MSIIQSRPEGLVHPGQEDRRRVERLAAVAADLALGTMDVVELKTKLSDDVDVPEATNLVKAFAGPIGHANVSAARALGFIVPGP